MATDRIYSKTKLAAADIVTSHIIFPCTNFFYPPGGILKTVNKFIVIKLNTKNLDKIRLKNSKNQSKKLQQFTKYSTDFGERESRPFHEEPETLLYFN